MSAIPNPLAQSTPIPAQHQCSPDTVLPKVTNCYDAHNAPPPNPLPELPETPRPDPDLNPRQLLAANIKPLTPQQLLAIDLLLAGRSDTKTAAILNVHRVTITRWRLYNHVFQAELNRRRQETWGQAADRIRHILSKAVRVFQKQIVSQDQHIAFRAARALLHLAGSSHLVAPPNPDLAPIDPSGVLELHARKLHIQLNSIDPRHDPLYDEDMALALRTLMHKNATDPLPHPDPADSATISNTDAHGAPTSST